MREVTAPVPARLRILAVPETERYVFDVGIGVRVVETKTIGIGRAKRLDPVQQQVLSVARERIPGRVIGLDAHARAAVIRSGICDPGNRSVIRCIHV